MAAAKKKSVFSAWMLWLFAFLAVCVAPTSVTWAKSDLGPKNALGKFFAETPKSTSKTAVQSVEKQWEINVATNKTAVECSLAPKTGATGAFNPGSSVPGQGLGKLASAEVSVSGKGLSLVENHLATFDRFTPNEAMVGRLREALASGSKISGADASFYLHEAAEATMMGRGMLYGAAHDAALLKYQVSPFSVYHPAVIQSNPGLFNSSWYNFWGVSK